MSYIGYVPAAKPLTSADITDSVVTSAKIVDGTIAIADLSATGTPSSTTFLRGDNTWGAVSSDYVLLATTTASSSAAVSFDGYYSSTYKNYKVIISNAIPSTDSVFFYVRFRRSNADVTASNYSHILGAFYIQNDGGVGAPGIDYLGLWATSYIRTNYEYLSNTTSTGGINLNVDIYDPLNASSYKSIYINGVSQNANSTKVMSYANSGLLRDSTAALSGITFYMSSGNIASGTFKLYGIK